MICSQCVDGIESLLLELINQNLQTDFLLFADVLLLTVPAEDDLQYSVLSLNTVSVKYGLIINIKKTKSVSFCVKYPVPSEIYVDNKLIEKIHSFTFLVYTLSTSN